MKPSGIGGQAVIEGIMMRNGGKYAVAVRTADQKIVVDVQNCSSSRIQNKKFAKLPIVRGVINFFDSMILGMKALMYSASQFAEETDEERAEREGKARKKAAAKAEKLRSQGKEAQAQAVLNLLHPLQALLAELALLAFPAQQLDASLRNSYCRSRTTC